MVCNQCNTEYEVLVDVDVTEMVSVTDVDMETPYCPFCGCECDEWSVPEDDVDV